MDRVTKQSTPPPPPHPQSPTNGDLFEQENNITLGEWEREGSLFPFYNW